MSRFHTCHGPQMRATQVMTRTVSQVVAHQLDGPDKPGHDNFSLEKDNA
jgi:hypothetical protein